MKLQYLLLLASIFVESAGARAANVGQDGLIRDAEGNLLFMNRAQAVKACADQKMHLPTIRELAKMSQAMGAKGILETSEVKKGEVPNYYPDFYFLVSAINPNGQKDEFYFNISGFVPPDGDWRNNWFWSSSVLSNHSGLGYVLVGYSADISHDFRVARYAVRCAAGP